MKIQMLLSNNILETHKLLSSNKFQTHNLEDKHNEGEVGDKHDMPNTTMSDLTMNDNAMSNCPTNLNLHEFL